MFAYKSIGYLHQLLKKADICLLFYFIKSLYGISNLESGITEKEEKKRKAILSLAYNIANVSCLTNCLFYMRTLSLSGSNTMDLHP